MPDYKTKQVFVFDWDGTLFDSMATKSENFAQVITSYFPCNHTDARKQYLELSGRPRREIFITIATRCGLSPEGTILEQMSTQLSELNTKSLIQSPLFDDAIPLLETLRQQEKQMFISSSVPQNELAELVQKKLPESIRQHITDVFGSAPGFSKGKEHLNRIMKDAKADASDCVVIGDDLADAELAREAGVEAAIVDRNNRFGGSVYPRIASLQEVTSCLI